MRDVEKEHRPVSCNCPISKAGQIEHYRICEVVADRRGVLRLYVHDKSPEGRVVNLRRRRLRTARRRAGKQAAA